jgi:hypothetical protein
VFRRRINSSITSSPHGFVDSLDGIGPVLYDVSLTGAVFTVLVISITYVRSFFHSPDYIPPVLSADRLFLEFFNKRLSVKTSNVIVELVRLTVLWAWWLSAGTIYYSLLFGPYSAETCKLYDPVDRASHPSPIPTFNLTAISLGQQPHRCQGLIVIPILCLVNFALRE